MSHNTCTARSSRGHCRDQDPMSQSATGLFRSLVLCAALPLPPKSSTQRHVVRIGTTCENKASLARRISAASPLPNKKSSGNVSSEGIHFELCALLLRRQRRVERIIGKGVHVVLVPARRVLHEIEVDDVEESGLDLLWRRVAEPPLLLRSRLLETPACSRSVGRRRRRRRGLRRVGVGGRR